MEKIKKIRRKIKDGSLREMFSEAKWIFHYVIQYKKEIILYICIGVMGTLLGLLGTVASKYVIDAVTQFDKRLLIRMLVLFGLTGFGGIALNAVMNRMLTKISLKVNSEILLDVYEKILNTEWDFMNRYHSGDLLNRTNADVSTVAGSVLGWVPSLVMKSVHFFGSLLIILYYDPIMGAMALCSAPITMLLSRALLYRMREYNKKMRRVSSDMMGFTQESFQNMQSIKAFHLTEMFGNRLKSVQRDYIHTSLEYNEFSIRTSVFMSCMSMIVSFACLGWGVYRLWTGYITYGTMTLFLQTARSLASDFAALVHLIPSAVSAMTSAGRIMDVTGLPQETRGNYEKIAKLAIQMGRGLTLEMRDIAFSYKEGKQVLKDSQLLANPGEIIGVKGKSGSGKTTLFQLILGILHSQGGRAVLRANSGDEENVGAGTRKFFAYVPQGNTVFSGTIADNLRMMAPSATNEELIDALKIACAWEFVKDLPDGIYSIVGEKGLGLSEGQAQRIAIARAVLKKAPIILFDECTSALDVGTAQKVLKNIQKKAEYCTCILASHSSFVLELCDRVYEIEDRKVKVVESRSRE